MVLNLSMSSRDISLLPTVAVDSYCYCGYDAKLQLIENSFTTLVFAWFLTQRVGAALLAGTNVKGC